MKPYQILLVSLVALACFVGVNRWLSISAGSTRAVSNATEVTAVPLTSASTVDLRGKWRNMSRTERAHHLERLGYFPDYADQRDWSLAAATSWWGRRLNAKEFWGTNVVWLDSNAMYRAQMYGRQFPPIPDELQNRWKEFSDRDVVSKEVGIDSLVVRSVYSERESVFWDNFAKVMPKPPNIVDDYLKRLSRQFMGTESTTVRRPVRRVLINETPEEHAAGLLRRDSELGFPPELYDAEVLRLAYVANMHDEYKRLSQEGNDAEKVADWLKSLYVDSGAVVRGLTREQQVAMNLWR